MPQADLNAAIAANRFGLGARPGELTAIGADPRGWLLAQIRPGGAALPGGDTPNGKARLQALADLRAANRQDDRSADQRARDRQTASRAIRADVADAQLLRFQLATTTLDAFAERWTLFWSNWFTVSGANFNAQVVLDAYEREAIRPRVFGRFADLLIAAERHPAMLLYLDQARSVGPNSPAGRRREAGLNENLAREILELHTVGADGGYAQADVTEFARALTGWSTPTGQARNDADVTGFLWRPEAHEPGVRTVMGRRHADGGEDQAAAVMRDLAVRPATARRVALALSRHFVADAPPAALATRLERAFLDSGGDLAQVARALITADQAWTPEPAKLKTPYEFIVSAYRAGRTRPETIQDIRPILTELGQPMQAAPSPEGWPDDAASWAAPDGVIKRLLWSQVFAEANPPRDPAILADVVLGPRLGAASRAAVARAGSRSDAFALLLMSPEFQRR